MSLVLAGSVAVRRDLADPGKPIQCPTVPASSTPIANPPTATTNFSHLIVAQIPTEALLAYTTLLALLWRRDEHHQARWAATPCHQSVSGRFASYLRQRTYPDARVRRRESECPGCRSPPP
jgi:hypothetical protein